MEGSHVASSRDMSVPLRAAGSRRGVRWREFVLENFVRIAGGSAIFIVALIFFFLLREGIPAFWEVSLRNLLSVRWYPTFDLFGMLPLIYGSLMVTAGAIVIAVPLGLATAIYMREVAPSWVREILKPLIEVIAGIPSVVLGFLGMIAIVPLVREWTGLPTGLTAFTGSIILAYMALPTIISIAEDAIDAVPRSYRDGALALGATHWQTMYRVILPAARSGILTAIMLGLGRAIGETMAVLMVTGNAARMPQGWAALFRPLRTMTATIAAEMGEVAQGSSHYHVLFAVGIVLFVITFAVNAVASIIALRGTPRRGGRLMG
jgi:phosphate transport system permease protein